MQSSQHGDLVQFDPKIKQTLRFKRGTVRSTPKTTSKIKGKKHTKSGGN